MQLRGKIWLLACALLGGCAVPGHDPNGPQPIVVDRSRPAESGSPYESPGSTPKSGESDPYREGSSGQAGPAHSAPRTRDSSTRELPTAAAALLAQAHDHRTAGRLPEAAVTLERALRIAPREPRIYRELAEVRLAEGKVAQAEQFARKGISLAGGADDEQARLWTVVAECRWAAKDSEGALDAERRAKELRGSGWQFW